MGYSSALDCFVTSLLAMTIVACLEARGLNCVKCTKISVKYLDSGDFSNE